MRLSILSTLVVALIALSGCETTSTLAHTPMPETAPPSESSAPESPASVSSVYGMWEYTATNSRQTIQGQYTLSADPADHRMKAPGLASEQILGSVLNVEGTSIEWTGGLMTMGGFSGFRIVGTLDGDTVEGTTEIDALGTFSFTATRVQ